MVPGGRTLPECCSSGSLLLAGVYGYGVHEA